MKNVFVYISSWLASYLAHQAPYWFVIDFIFKTIMLKSIIAFILVTPLETYFLEDN
jgi:hypothetical protein